MKDIKESFDQARSISEMIEHENINEGLRDWLNAAKSMFKHVWTYIKGVVAKIGVYFVAINKDGEVIAAISPLTAGQAYKDGYIDKSNTLVVMDREGKRITGDRAKYMDGIKLYGSGNSIQYWMLFDYAMEAREKELGHPINEVKLHTEDPEAKYSIIADNDDLQEEIELHIKNPKLAKLLIWGAPGIGKTAILMNIVKKMQDKFPDYKMIMKTLSNETPDNFTLPKYIELNGSDFATDVPKTWLPVYKPTGDKAVDAQADEACGQGLLFIDELSRATPQVLNVVLPLVNEGVFNGYVLGSKWSIICASNRAEDEMSGQSSIGNALANRFDQVYYEPTVNSWRKWADQQNFMSPLLLQWLSLPSSENMSGQKYYYMDPNEEYEGSATTTLMCTPRAWTNAMRKLATFSHTGTLEGFTIFDIPTRIIARTLNGTIPATAIDSFLAFLEVVKSIGNFDDVVESIWKKEGKGFKITKANLRKVSLPLAQLICTSHAGSLPTEKEFASLCKWVAAQDSDQLASYVLDVFRNTYIGMLPENRRDGILVVQDRIDMSKAEGKEDELPVFASAYKPFTDKWGVRFEDIPRYSTGLDILATKYGESFENTKIDGAEAFG